MKAIVKPGFSRSEGLSIRPGILRLLLVLTLAAGPFLSSSNLWATEQEPAPQAIPCSGISDPSWSEQEILAWKSIANGEVADPAKLCGPAGAFDPNVPDDCGGTRILRKDFIQAILLREPYRSCIPYQGVHLRGVWFKDALDLAHAPIERPILLENCRFDGKVDLNYMTSTGRIVITGCKFLEDLDLGGARIRDTLSITAYGAEKAGAEPIPSKFDGNLILRDAKIDGFVYFSDARISGNLDMANLQVGTWFMSDRIQCGAREGAMTLTNAKLGAVYLTGGRFAGDVDLGSVQVKEDLAIYAADGPPVFEKGINLSSAHIDSHLHIMDGSITSLGLSGATIKDELRLGPDLLEHSGGLRLSLHNARIGFLQVPAPIRLLKDRDLIQCTYDHLNWLSQEPDEQGKGVKLKLNDAAWLWDYPPADRPEVKPTEWFCSAGEDQGSDAGRKKGRYSAQPCDQLADVLKKEGRAELAAKVLFFKKEVERSSSEGLRYVLLTLQLVLFGYGYEYHIVFYSTLLLILMGSFVIRTTSEARKHSLPWCIAYSLEMLLPFMQIDKQCSAIQLTGFARFYFTIHKFAGYVLAFFLVAAITGISK